jgi:16S rRNA processing protein RimM
MTDKVCVGAISGAFGVAGEVRIKSFCAEPADIATYGPVYLDREAAGRTLNLTRPVGGGYAARLSGVGDRNAAEALRGRRLYVPRDALPRLPDDEFYHADLLGLEVVDPGGRVLGRVKAVLNHGAGDILEIASPSQGGGSLLLPFTRVIVPTVDLGAGRIVADPPDMTGTPDPGDSSGEG